MTSYHNVPFLFKRIMKTLINNTQVEKFEAFSTESRYSRFSQLVNGHFEYNSLSILHNLEHILLELV